MGRVSTGNWFQGCTQLRLPTGEDTRDRGATVGQGRPGVSRAEAPAVASPDGTSHGLRGSPGRLRADFCGSCRLFEDVFLSSVKTAMSHNASRAPSNQRRLHGFQVNHKLEAVDRRNPMLIRVATVTETEDCRVKVRGRPAASLLLAGALTRCVCLQIHYDGWSQQFDIWCDSDNSDLHPAGWCQRTGHPLEPPPGVWDGGDRDRQAGRRVLTSAALCMRQGPPRCPPRLRACVPPPAAEASATSKERATPDTTGESGRGGRR